MKLPMYKEECCVSGDDKEICLCGSNLTMNLLSRKWSLLIIWLLAKYGKLRYSDMAKKLDGVNHNTLSIRLDELEEIGIIKRQKFNEIPPRVEYSLTKLGEELSRITKPLLSFTASAKVFSENKSLI
jgi:DNA-binding HxlR family transcriptional regulator